MISGAFYKLPYKCVTTAQLDDFGKKPMLANFAQNAYTNIKGASRHITVVNARCSCAVYCPSVQHQQPGPRIVGQGAQTRHFVVTGKLGFAGELEIHKSLDNWRRIQSGLTWR